jgi:hypothetical protein
MNTHSPTLLNVADKNFDKLTRANNKKLWLRPQIVEAWQRESEAFHMPVGSRSRLTWAARIVSGPRKTDSAGRNGRKLTRQAVMLPLIATFQTISQLHQLMRARLGRNAPRAFLDLDSGSRASLLNARMPNARITKARMLQAREPAARMLACSRAAQLSTGG